MLPLNLSDHSNPDGTLPRSFPRRSARFLGRILFPAPVSSGRLALFLLFIVIWVTGLEAAYVQTTTTHTAIDSSLLRAPSFLFLFSLDLLVPLTVALLSRRLFIVYLAFDCLQNIILLHYNIFFYNTLTLATIYHSMHGAASLGLDIFGFARWDMIAVLIFLFMSKAVLVQLSRVGHTRMPWVWKLRGITAVTCMAVIWYVSSLIYGQTGLSGLWVDKRGHRTASERRLEQGAREAVRNIGYLATWIGEWRSGTYKDTDLIYAEMRCQDPDAEAETEAGGSDSKTGTAPATWQGFPVPHGKNTVVLVQVESLDFAALGMKVSGHTVLPFIDHLAQVSLTLKAFAPHKVGSSNSDYEILNQRVADQNVMYYSYITHYPDSVIQLLAKQGYRPTVFHGLDGKLFNLRAAYAAQGFAEFFFKEDLIAAGYGPSTYIMEHVLDEDVLDMAAAELRRGDGPKAQFIITMSSHIPFMDPLPIFKKVGGVFSRYVSSLRYVDQCLAAFYAQLPEDTLLIIWGDHGSDVTYPQGFPESDRHVPFIVHIKGDTDWMGKMGAKPEKGLGENQDGDDLPAFVPKDMLDPMGKVDSSRPANQRVYTLCELGHFLRRIVAHAQPFGKVSSEKDEFRAPGKYIDGDR